MKFIEVVIDGDIDICEYCSHSHYEKEEYEGDKESAFYGEYYETIGWKKINGIYLREIKSESDAGEYLDVDEYENVVKQKGKYVKTKEYFHELFGEDSVHPLPVDIHVRTKYNYQLSYVIKLEDDEEFDIKKVQLIKSDYEMQDFPYFILAEHILYDEKEIEVYDMDGEYSELCIDGKYYNEYTIEEFY